jgi:hypothetical protein
MYERPVYDTWVPVIGPDVEESAKEKGRCANAADDRQ